MSKTASKEILTIQAMAFLYASFIIVCLFIPPDFDMAFIICIPYFIFLAYAMLVVNKYKSLSHLIMYSRLQFLNGILSVYTIVLVWEVGKVLLANDQSREWEKNNDFIFLLVAFDCFHFALVLLSKFHINRLIQERKEFVTALSEIAETLEDDEKRFSKLVGDNDETVTVKLDKTRVPPEWASLYPEDSHVV